LDHKIHENLDMAINSISKLLNLKPTDLSTKRIRW